VIPLNQLIPECLLALGGAFLLGNLAAYIRLRPAWRDAKQGGGQRAKRDARAVHGVPAAERDARAGRGVPAAERDARAGRGVPAAKGDARVRRGGQGTKGDAKVKSGGAKAAARTRAGSSARVNSSVRAPTASGSRLPSRARVLANVIIGLVITVAALATLIRG
jgi:hypothetical protein